jgi:hypothetical protein
VINLLHKDYSLLAADKQAIATGPVTLKADSMTNHVEGGVKIEGIRKIDLNVNKRMALGFAGTTSAHGCRENFADCATPVAQVLWRIRF